MPRLRSRFLAVAFDMDGLMFDTEDVYWKTASLLLQKRGFEYTQELCDELMGRPPKYCFQRMIEKYDLKETWEKLHNESEATFINLLDEGFSMMPGLLPVLSTLEKKRIPKSVCTSSSLRVAHEILQRKQVLEHFQFILAFEDTVQGKPNPEIYIKAAKRFRVPMDRMLVLEDSVSGCSAAREAGAFVVAVLARHNRNLSFDHASLVVDRLDAPEVLELLM